MNIMIAYDGSRNARLALAQTVTMFRALSPRLTLVAVAENPRDITSSNEDLFQEEVSELKGHLKEALEVCQSQGVEAETMLLDGEARKMLLFAAEKKVRPDMLVLARHSHEPAEAPGERAPPALSPGAGSTTPGPCARDSCSRR